MNWDEVPESLRREGAHVYPSPRCQAAVWQSGWEGHPAGYKQCANRPLLGETFCAVHGGSVKADMELAWQIQRARHRLERLMEKQR